MNGSVPLPPDVEQPFASDAIQKPIMVYDGACNFCRFWVDRWRRTATAEVNFVPYQEVPEEYFGITQEQFSKSVYLITRYRRLKGAAAVFEVLALGGNDLWNSLYYNVVFADEVFEFGYRMVANNRDFFFWLTKIFYKSAKAYNNPPPKV